MLSIWRRSFIRNIMTRIKSLKYEIEKNGRGYIHRTHRSKKNRKYTPKYEKVRLYRKRIEQLKQEEMDKEIKIYVQ